MSHGARIPARAGARRRRSPHPARRLRAQRQRHRGALRPRRPGAGGPLAGPSRPAAGRHQPRQVLLRGARSRSAIASSTPAASPASTASGRRPPRRRTRIAPSTSRCASRSRPPVQLVIRKRDRRNLFREVWSVRVDPAGPAVDRARPARRPEGVGRLRERAARREGGPAAHGRRLHGGGDGQVARGRAPPGRDALRGVAVQGAAPRLQRVGGGHACRRERRGPPLGRRAPALAAARGLRRLRLRALRARLRQQAAARGRGGRALRLHRDRGERPQVRRRRHPQPLRHRLGRQRLHALRVRARVRPSLRRPGRRVLHLARWPTRRAGSASSPGSPTSPPIPRARAGPTSSRRGRRCPRPGRRRSSRRTQLEVQGRRRRDPRGEAAGGGDGGAVPRGARAQHAAPRFGAALGCGGRLRGRDVRGEGLLPAAVGLHHVHPRRGGLLRGLPAGHRAGHRPATRASR